MIGHSGKVSFDPFPDRWNRMKNQLDRNIRPGALKYRTQDNEHDMPRSPLPRVKGTTDPAQLPDAERAYYRATWGFDLVDD